MSQDYKPVPEDDKNTNKVKTVMSQDIFLLKNMLTITKTHHYFTTVKPHTFEIKPFIMSHESGNSLRLSKAAHTL